MSRSFAPPEPHRPPAFVARPPVGEEGAAYCVVRRYLWPEDPRPSPVAGEGRNPDPREPGPAPALPPGARS
jgi:hypothetical protein